MSPDQRRELFRRAGEIVYARHMGAIAAGFTGTTHQPASLQEALRAHSIASDRHGPSRMGACDNHPGTLGLVYRVERHDPLRNEMSVSWLCAECLAALHDAVIA